VQPEALAIVPAGSDSHGGVTGTVEGVAFIGDATELVVRVGDSMLVSKVATAAAPAIGTAVAVRIHMQTCTLLS
jgi:hypothetical protein